jgi:protein-disulfide isomerase
MRRLLLTVALASISVTALADRRAPPIAKTDAQRIRDLEQQVADLQRELADAKAKLAAANPPPRPSRPQLDLSRHYRVPLDDSPSMGPSPAPITIVAALQFPEPYTHKAWPTLMQLLSENKDVRLVVKSFIVHPRHARSSIAACAAGLQGELDRMEGEIYQASSAPDPTTGQTMGLRELTDADTRDIAKSLRLNVKQFDRDLPMCEAAQQRDIAMFSALGQGSVPIFWINGRPLSGAQPIDSFRTVINEERSAWKKAKAAGAHLAAYYDKVTDTKPNPY